MGSERPVDQECVEGYLFVRAPPQILVLRRPPSRGSIWVPVSGKVEPTDASFEAAVAREVQEETGFVDGVQYTPLDWTVSFAGPDGRWWRLHGFAGELPEPRSPVLSDEHDGYEWVSFAEAEARLHFSDNREAVQRLAARFQLGRTETFSTPRGSTRVSRE